MLIPEISLLASAAGLLFALISCLLVLVSKRKMQARMDELRFELEVHLSANHEMAKQLRALQKTVSLNVTAKRSEGFTESADDRHDLWEGSSKFDNSRRDSSISNSSISNSSISNSSRNEEYAPKAGLSLAEKLGLSQTEADIITHLRPRKKRLMDTA